MGWIAGVSEAGKLTTMWSDETTAWSAGPCPRVAGSGSRGADWSPTGRAPSCWPPATAAASAARPTAPSPATHRRPTWGRRWSGSTSSPNGRLKPVDFFAPYDAPALDTNDLDFGSGSPVALPDQYFGTTSTPHLLIAVGKEGYVYLLNRDSLGGEGEGPNGTDNIVGRFGPNGGVWSSPAVWPGDGGWIYIPTASGRCRPTRFCRGHGRLSVRPDRLRYADPQSGRSVIGRLRVRLERARRDLERDDIRIGIDVDGVVAGRNRGGSPTAGLRPRARGWEVCKEVFSAPVGTASKFNPPGVGGNRLYVGTRDGNVIGFGAPVSAPVTAASPTFPATVVGKSSTETLTVTANSAVTVTALSVSNGAFTAREPEPGPSGRPGLRRHADRPGHLHPDRGRPGRWERHHHHQQGHLPGATVGHR